VLDDNRVVNVLLILDESLTGEVDTIGSLPVKTLGGDIIAIRDVAEITQASGPYNVLHRSGQRLQAVTGNVDHGDVAAFVSELQSRIDSDVEIPADMHIEFAGSGIEEAKARMDLIVHSMLAAVGVLMLIYLAVGCMRNVALIALNLPFALVGGVVAVIVTGAGLSLGSLVGFVTLFGITVRNSIMLVSHYQHLVAVEGQSWELSTAVRGAEERFPSITMTTLVTALAMLPIAINSDNPGREIMGPMAAIVIGGLVSSAVLNLLIMPAMMLHFGRFERTAAAAD
jgi:Cu/Ag efflux pump CusA